MSLKRDRDDQTEHDEEIETKRSRSEPLYPEQVTRDEDGDQQQPSEVQTLLYPNTTRPVSGAVTPVPFQQPTQLTTFSYSAERVLVFDNSALKYYVEPPRGAKLNYGYERWVKQQEERGRIDSLLRALSEIRRDPTRRAAVKELGVVSWRGVMTKMLTAPYEERDGWELNVMNVNGTLYFEEYTSDARLEEKQNMNPRQSMQTYYGYAFESYCTSDTPRRPNSSPTLSAPFGWSGDVNNNIQWCSVVRTKLGSTRILIGGEVDCVRDRYTGQPDTFVELKTSLTIRGPHDEPRFEKKLLKFYFQSFLLGVPEIIVGFRTPAGVVSTVQSFKTVELPRLVRGKPGGWDPVTCLDWGNQFLTFLQSAIPPYLPGGSDVESGPKVWRVEFSPGSGVTLGQLDTTEMSDVVRGEDRVGFLPRWYWTELAEERM